MLLTYMVHVVLPILGSLQADLTCLDKSMDINNNLLWYISQSNGQLFLNLYRIKLSCVLQLIDQFALNDDCFDCILSIPLVLLTLLQACARSVTQH